MAVKAPIYLDHNATTPIDPRVLEAMMPYLTDVFGNAASRNHSFGWQAEEAVERAREQIADLIGAGPKEIVFTSGATESDNLAIKGAAQMYRDKGNHIITAKTEHKAVIDTCRKMEKDGFDVAWLDPDEYGVVSPEKVAAAITDKTILITIMAANNEIGVLNPVAEIGKVAKARGVLFHCDATQAVGKIPVNVEQMQVDLLSMSGHKIYGPKGIGALYVRGRGPRVRLVCQMDGGGHERGMRSGTLNVPGAVGMGKACDICRAEMGREAARVRALRDRLYDGIASRIEHVTLNGHRTQRLGNTLNLSFEYVEGEALMMKMKDIAVSSGSACTSASLEPSHVLHAMGLREDLAHNSIRFSLGRSTTEEEIDYTIDRVARAVEELREISPLYEVAMAKAGSKQGAGQAPSAREGT
ncbi:MAG: IscS subfamily cysteine desulfurase [Phycisphaerae bacterium]|nr:IscS subfamily cysteine desulfurase [Phycisphaerae bacterium]